MAVNRLSQTLSSSPALEPSQPLRRMSVGAGGAQSVTGTLQKGAVEKFDALANPFVKVQPAHIERIFAEGSRKAGGAGLVKEHDGKVQLALNRNNVRTMHDEVLANPKIRERFLQKPGLMQRFGDRVVAFLRNVGSAVGISDNEVSAHLRTDIERVDGKQRMRLETRGTEQRTGNGEVAGEMRIRRREGLIRSGLRKLFVNNLNALSGGRWFKNATTTAVKQQRLDQMRASAQNMAMKMSWFKDGETSEADENFDTLMEMDADFLKESNFLGGLREFHEKRSGASADVSAALAAAQALIDDGKKLDTLTPGQVATLRFEFQRLYREDLNQELELIDQDPGHQTAQAVFAKGQEFRDLVAAEKARGEQAIAKSKANPDNPVAGAEDRKAFLAGRGERLEKIAKLAAELRDPDGAFKRMREGRALVRGLLPVVMLHSSDKLQTYLKDQLADEYTSLLSWSGTKKYYRQAAEAIYEGIVKGVSESLVESLAMNEADRMKDDAKTFVDGFQNELQAQQDRVWQFAEENFGASLLAANALFLDGDNAGRQREAQAAGHAEIADKVKAMREQLRAQGAADKLSLSPQVNKTLTTALDQIERENAAVARSTEHLFDVLGPNGKLQTTLDRHEQSLVNLLGDGRPGSVRIDAATLQKIRADLGADLQALRETTRGLEGDLTKGHGAILTKALVSAERRMDRALRDVERLSAAARGAAAAGDPAELRELEADMEKLAADVQGAGADGTQRSRNGVLPSARHDAVFKAGVERLARSLAVTLKDAAGLASLYQTNRSEMTEVVRAAPQRPGRAPGESRIVDALSRLDEAYRSAEAVVGRHRERVADSALMAGVAVRPLSAAFRSDELDVLLLVQQRVVARGLGLDATVEPKPSAAALDFLANFRNEDALAIIHDILHEGLDPNPAPRQMNERFNALLGGLQASPARNDPATVGGIALRLFGKREFLTTGLAFLKQALPAGRATQAERQLRRQVLDASLDSVRGNPAVADMLRRQVPGADLSSNEGLLRAFAKVEASLGAGDPARELILGQQNAFGAMADAYVRLGGPAQEGEVDGVETQTLYDQLQQMADVFAGRPHDRKGWHRYQARVALDQLLYNVTKKQYGLADLRGEPRPVGEAVESAVSVKNLAVREDYRRISEQMRGLVERIDGALAAATQERVLMREPLRQLQKRLEPETAARLQARVESNRPEDREYVEKLLNYGAMMTLVDGVLRSDVGGLQHRIAGLNPVDNPDLFAAPGKWTIRRPFDFSPLRAQGWGAERMAAAKAEQQAVADFFKTGGPVEKGPVRDMLVARIKAARNIDLQVRKAWVRLIENGQRLAPEALHLLREKTSLDRQTTDGVKQASDRRIQRFEEELTAAQQYAMDYQYFDPQRLDFDDVLQARHERIREDNPYRYNALQKALGLDGRREAALIAQGYTQDELDAFRRADGENANAVIRRLGGQRGAMRRGLEVYQFLRSAKMAEVYQRAAQDDGASFRELKQLRDAYLDGATRLAREQALRAGVLMAWEDKAISFEAFAADPDSAAQIQRLCVKQLGMGQDGLAARENVDIRQLAREELNTAQADPAGTFRRWAEEADQYEGRLLKLQRDFETGVDAVRAKLESARVARSGADAADGQLADDALAAMREQTAATIASYRLKLAGEVFPRAREIALLRMQHIAKEPGNRSGDVSRLVAQAEKEFVFSEGDTWQDIADQATDWIRRAERAAAGTPSAVATNLIAPEAAEGDRSGRIERVVDDALMSRRRLEEQTATNMLAADFEADMRIELADLNRHRITQENIARNRTAIVVFGPSAVQDLLPTTFKSGSPWMKGVDCAAQPLESGAQRAIDVLDGIIARADGAKDANVKARAEQATVLRKLFVELETVGGAVRNLEDLRASSETLPLVRKIRDEQLLPALARFKTLMEAPEGWGGIPDRSRSLRPNASAEGNTIEALRAGLGKDFRALLEVAQKSVARMNEELPGAANLDDAMDSEVDGVVDEAVAEGGPVPELIAFQSDPVDDIAIFLPESRALCEQIRGGPGGETALFQLRNILLDGVAGEHFEGAKSTAVELLRDIAARFAPAPAGRNVPTLAELGLQTQATRGDGNCFFNAIADQLPGVSPAEVRRRVVGEMQKVSATAGKPPSGVSRPTPAQITNTAKDASIHGMVAWGDDSHAGYVARVFNRPVVLLGRDRALVFERDKDTVELAAGAGVPPNALFLVHNGGNHWEGVRSVADRPAGNAMPARQPATGAPATAGAQKATEADKIASGFATARERYERALNHYLPQGAAGAALARANVARQELERIIENAKAPSADKATAQAELKRIGAEFVAAFNKQFPGAKLTALESLKTMRENRAQHVVQQQRVGALQPGVPPDSQLLDGVAALRKAAPVSALSAKTAVVSVESYVTVLEVELALAQHYAKVADERLEEERAADAKLVQDKKNAAAAKTKKDAAKGREEASRKAAERLLVATQYHDALNASPWFDRSRSDFVKLQQRLRAFAPAARK